MTSSQTAGRIGRTTLELRLGNIVKLSADALVTTANAALSGGGGVDRWIHLIGGPAIKQQCKIIGRCDTGNAVITGAGDLQATYIIHAVAPRYSGKARDITLLRSAYTNALLRAEEVGAKTIAFPSLGTDDYGFPIDVAAPVAIDAVGRHVSSGTSSLERVIFVLSTEAEYGVYQRLFPKRAG